MATAPVEDAAHGVISGSNRGSSPSVMGGLELNSDPLIRVTLACIPNDMSASTGVWTSPSYS